MKTILIIGLIIGFLLIYFFILLQFLKSKCTTKIIGKFLKVNKYIGSVSRVFTTYYAPVFQYTFNNITYKKQTFQSFSKKYIKKHFVFNENYTIYINSNNPKIFIIEKNFQLSDLLIFLMGCIFVILSFLGFLA